MARNIPENKTFNVSEPWFSLIQSGQKKVEGRLAKSRFAEIQVGDILKWTNSEQINTEIKQVPREIITRVSEIVYYPDFESYLAKERLKNCLPGVRTIKEGVDIYHKFYPKEERKKYKVMAIHINII